MSGHSSKEFGMFNEIKGPRRSTLQRKHQQTDMQVKLQASWHIRYAWHSPFFCYAIQQLDVLDLTSSENKRVETFQFFFFVVIFVTPQVIWLETVLHKTPFAFFLSFFFFLLFLQVERKSCPTAHSLPVLLDVCYFVFFPFRLWRSLLLCVAQFHLIAEEP